MRPVPFAFVGVWGFCVAYSACAQWKQQGIASYYASRFEGRLTASGEVFSNQMLTAAHPTLPFGTRVRVTCARTMKSVVVRINDRGPFIHGRIIDLSQAAADSLDLLHDGIGWVIVEAIQGGKDHWIAKTVTAEEEELPSFPQQWYGDWTGVLTHTGGEGDIAEIPWLLHVGPSLRKRLHHWIEIQGGVPVHYEVVESEEAMCVWGLRPADEDLIAGCLEDSRSRLLLRQHNQWIECTYELRGTDSLYVERCAGTLMASDQSGCLDASSGPSAAQGMYPQPWRQQGLLLKRR